MLMPRKRTAAHYRLQAAHVREFIETIHEDVQLRAVLVEAAARLDQLAAEVQANRRARTARRKGASSGNLILADSFSAASGV
jgi:hypothetical protein